MAYLEDPRVLYAAERTALAWTRTSITLIGLGFAVERFELFLHVMTQRPFTFEYRSFSFLIGIGLVMLGAITAIASGRQFSRTIASLGAREVPLDYARWNAPLLNYTVGAAAIVLCIYLVVSGGS